MMKRFAAALLAALLMLTGVSLAEDAAQTERVIELMAELSSLKAQIVSLKAEVASRDEQIAALTAEVEELKKQLGEPVTLVGEVDPSLCGKWYADEIRIDDLTFNPAAMGAEMSLTLNEDGMGTLYMSGEEPEAFTWAAQDDEVMLLFDDEADFLILEDGTLTLNEDGMEITFVRENGNGTSSKVKKAAVLSDFSGEWLATRGSISGMEMSMEDMDFEFRVTVDGRYATFTKKEDGKVNESSGYGMLLGGTLTVFGSVGQDDLVLQMLEDGRMMLEVEMTDDLLVTYYFEKIK